ncbi:MAG: transposase [Patescibacteria group bacterium]
MKKPPFLNDHIYHIYNRGVEKRDVFMDDHDYFQFIHDLFEFNDKNPVNKLQEDNFSIISTEVQPPQIRRKRNNDRELLVEILAFVLMPNHFHLLLKQKNDDGVVKFMQKIGTGYTMSFNKKYDRVGSLFQGRFKAVLVEREDHLLFLPNYIHLNPIKIKRDFSVNKNLISAVSDLEFLEKYRWSSLPDYLGKKNFPSVISKEFLLEIIGNPREYRKELKTWLKKNYDFKAIFDEIV